MDAIKDIVRQLSTQGAVDSYKSISDQLRDDLANSSVLYSAKTALEQIEEENRRYLEQAANLNAGYDLRSATDQLLQQNLGARLALSNSYANLTGTQLLADQGLLSNQELINQLEAFVSPLASVKSALSQLVLPPNVEQSLGLLSVTGHLIGEFAYQGDIEPAFPEESYDPEKTPIREEVESRIIQVDYFPQKLFEAIRNEPKLMRGLEPRQFEEFTAELLAKLGFSSIQLTPRSGDGGRDVVATMDANGIPIVMAFECKKYAESNRIGPEILRTLLGTVSHGATKASKGVLVTTSSFTPGARKFMAAEALIDGKDFDELVHWLKGAGLRAGS